MKETFLYTLRALLPILLLIALGYGVRRLGGWSLEFYQQLNRLCFRLFLPVQLFCSVYAIEDLAALNWKLVGFQFGGVLACALMGVLAARLLTPDRRQKGPLVQAAFRSNQAILGLPLARALGGEAAMAYASISTSVCVTLFNVLAVTTLTCYSGDGKGLSIRKLLRRVITNPLILACLSGLLAVGLRQLLPTVDGQPVFTLANQLPSLYQVLQNLSRVASPVMLFVLGASLDFSAVRGLLPQLALGAFLRLALSPALVLGTALLLREPLGLTAVEMPTLVTVCASPVAVSSAVMVQEIGGDGQLASQLVVWTSVLSMVTIFVVVYLLRSAGFL